MIHSPSFSVRPFEVQTPALLAFALLVSESFGRGGTYSEGGEVFGN